MITKHELEASAESPVLPRDIASDWQALKDESVARVPRRGDDGPITLQGLGGLDPMDDGLDGVGGLDGVDGLGEIVPPTLAVPSLTEAAAAARQAAIGTGDHRDLALVGDEEEDTAVETNTLALAAGEIETNTLALAAGEIWADAATSPGDQAGLARDWARGAARSTATGSRDLDVAWPARVSAGVEIPPPSGAAVLQDRAADFGLRVTFGRVAAALVVTFVVGFAVGGWWLEKRGRSVGSWAAIGPGRTLPAARVIAPAAPPPVIVAPVVEPVASAHEAPAAAHEQAETPRARPVARRARGHRRNVIKLDELDLTLPDLPPSP